MNTEIRQGKICPYCLTPTVFTDSAIVYGSSYGMVYYCHSCKAHIGVHIGTEEALGSVANKETRDARRIAYGAFNSLWRLKMAKAGISEQGAIAMAYQWLADEMGMPEANCRIGLMDEKQCHKVTGICSKVLDKIHRKSILKHK